MPKQNLFIAILCLALPILAGCGTKGPLYIPEQRYPQKETETELPKEAPAPTNTN